jgi:serine/threonine-protein kinase
MTKARSSREGEVLAGKYRLDALLGSGGMGEVYRAENTAFGRVVAIKMLRDLYRDVPEVVDRFKQEAKAASRVRHPNVVDILDIGEAEDGTPFIVQEFLEGEDLASYVRSRGDRLSVEETARLLSPVIEAVGFAHERNVIHRDLKPENIFLARDANGRVTPKLLDFGISRIMTPDQQRMTATGMSIGTPAYMSPEQIRADTVIDARSDIWSIGVILHEILTGSLPFQSEAHSGLFVKIVTEPPVPLDVALPGAPKEIVAVVDRCLRAKIADRYASAAELLHDLRPLAGQETVAAPALAPRAPAPPPSRPDVPAPAVPDLELPMPSAKPKAAPPRQAVASASARASIDLADEIVPLSAPLDLAVQPMVHRPVARANRALRNSVDVEEPASARGFFGMAGMLVIVLVLCGAMTSFVPGGWSVVSWATMLDGKPVWISGGVPVLAVVLGIFAFVAGARAEPTSWGLIIAAPGLIADGLALAGFAVPSLPSLTGTGGLDQLERLLFPWPTMLVPLGLCLVALQAAWGAWSGYRRPSAAALGLVLAAAALFGAVEIARGAGDVTATTLAS